MVFLKSALSFVIKAMFFMSWIDFKVIKLTRAIKDLSSEWIYFHFVWRILMFSQDKSLVSEKWCVCEENYLELQYTM